MVCKTTSRGNRRRGAFTLVEMMVAIFIGLICVGVLMSVYVFSGRCLLVLGNQVDLEAQSRKSLDNMTREIRHCVGLTSYATNSITLKDYDNAAVTYSYNSTNKTLIRSKAGSATTVLTGCDNLSFILYDRDVKNGSFDLYPAGTANNCKAIRVTWNCSRKFIDSKLNTANNTSAIIVMRMK